MEKEQRERLAALKKLRKGKLIRAEKISLPASAAREGYTSYNEIGARTRREEVSHGSRSGEEGREDQLELDIFGEQPYAEGSKKSGVSTKREGMAGKKIAKSLNIVVRTTKHTPPLAITEGSEGYIGKERAYPYRGKTSGEKK